MLSNSLHEVETAPEWAQQILRDLARIKDEMRIEGPETEAHNKRLLDFAKSDRLAKSNQN